MHASMRDMKFPTPLLLILCVPLCCCTPNNTAGVRIHRLHTAAAHADEPPPAPPKKTLHKQPRFHIIKNDWLMNMDGDKHLEINLAAQRGIFFINGLPAMEFPVCTGKKGYETPTGTFSIKEKRRHHQSNIYHVPMPCFMRLTYDGIGLHVGEIRGTPASHGCIRLPHEACLPIFQAVTTGTRVVIY